MSKTVMLGVKGAPMSSITLSDGARLVPVKRLREDNMINLRDAFVVMIRGFEALLESNDICDETKRKLRAQMEAGENCARMLAHETALTQLASGIRSGLDMNDRTYFDVKEITKLVLKELAAKERRLTGRGSLGR